MATGRPLVISLARYATPIRQYSVSPQSFAAWRARPSAQFIGWFSAMQDPLPLEFENQTLEAALNKLSPRDRYIFFTHILNERSFKSLCAELGMTYSGVAVAYHRVVHKLRKALGGE